MSARVLFLFSSIDRHAYFDVVGVGAVGVCSTSTPDRRCVDTSVYVCVPVIIIKLSSLFHLSSRDIYSIIGDDRRGERANHS